MFPTCMFDVFLRLFSNFICINSIIEYSTFGLRLISLFSVSLVSPTAFPFEAKSQLASSPARSYVRTFVQTAPIFSQKTHFMRA